jgi:tagatose-1,6-bisphosphate aldolase non-catalytic subunit AgaZ/GatZ
MPLSLYKLQLSAYQSCLDKIGIKTVGRRIIWMQPDGNYEKIKIEHYVPQLRNALSDILTKNGGKYPSN